LPAGQGVGLSAGYWLGAQFFLHRLPVTTEILAARLRGSGATLNGYQLALDPLAGFVASWITGGVISTVTTPIAAADVGRMHVLAMVFNAGTMQLYLDGTLRNSAAGGTPIADVTDVMTVGNRLALDAPLQSATIMSLAGGQVVPTGPQMAALYAQTKVSASGYLDPAGITTNHQWEFYALPPIAVLGGRIYLASGPLPVFDTQLGLYVGDPAPEDYPPEFWLPIDHHVAYRIVGVSTDEDGGLVRRSIPSGATIVANTGPGAGSSVTLTIATGNSEVEVYRSRVFPLSVQPDDEMQLVGRYPLPAPPAGVSVTDVTPQDERGATLYTSPSRGGIIQQNEPPPACACVAVYKGSIFFGNTQGAQRMAVSYTYDPALTTITGIGMRSKTGTSGGGLTLITGLADTDGIEVGMAAARDNTNVIPARVTAKTATTVTVSPGMASGGAGTYRFYDTIWIDGVSYITPSPPATTSGARIPTILGGGLTGTNPQDVGFVTYLITPPAGGSTHTLVIETISRSASPVHTIRATHGAEYIESLPLVTDPATDMEQDVFPGGLSWSKTDEPEHVPPVNFAFVGDLKKAILALVPTRDALFILKEDGVFRLTGVNATWRIDPYDPTLFCCLPNSVVPLQEQAYFLSNKGVIAFSDGGSEIVSQPVDDVIHGVIDRVYSVFRDTGLYELPDVVGFVAGVYERENEYTMLTGRGPALAYVYNRNRQAWTTFSVAFPPDNDANLAAIFTMSHEGRIVYAFPFGDGGRALWTWLSTDAALGASALYPRSDLQEEVSIVAATESTADLASNVIAMADDVLEDSTGYLWRVAELVDGQAVLDLEPAPDGTLPALGDAILHRSIRCKITPQVYQSPPPRPKRWRAFSATFERFAGPVTLRYAYASAQSQRAPDAWDEENADVVKDLGAIYYSQGLAYAGLVPSAHARAWSMRASIRFAMAHGEARLEGAYVEAEAMEIGRQQRALP
jgi:concanavalin A-like lectin/glucanase superfamily protein